MNKQIESIWDYARNPWKDARNPFKTLILHDQCSRCLTWSTDLTLTPDENIICPSCVQELDARAETMADEANGR